MRQGQARIPGAADTSEFGLQATVGKPERAHWLAELDVAVAAAAAVVVVVEVERPFR